MIVSCNPVESMSASAALDASSDDVCQCVQTPLQVQCKLCGKDIRATGLQSLATSALSLSQTSDIDIEDVFRDAGPSSQETGGTQPATPVGHTQQTRGDHSIQSQSSHQTPPPPPPPPLSPHSNNTTPQRHRKNVRSQGQLYMLYSPSSPYVKLGCTSSKMEYLLGQYRRFEYRRYYYSCAIENVTPEELQRYEKQLFSVLSDWGYLPCAGIHQVNYLIVFTNKVMG
jgi:hypothetical protein